MQTYLESEVFSQVANNHCFANTTSKDFDILEAPYEDDTRGHLRNKKRTGDHPCVVKIR